jgi:hypothetical protein
MGTMAEGQVSPQGLPDPGRAHLCPMTGSSPLGGQTRAPRAALVSAGGQKKVRFQETKVEASGTVTRSRLLQSPGGSKHRLAQLPADPDPISPHAETQEISRWLLQHPSCKVGTEHLLKG